MALSKNVKEFMTKINLKSVRPMDYGLNAQSFRGVDHSITGLVGLYSGFNMREDEWALRIRSFYYFTPRVFARDVVNPLERDGKAEFESACHYVSFFYELDKRFSPCYARGAAQKGKLTGSLVLDFDEFSKFDLRFEGSGEMKEVLSDERMVHIEDMLAMLEKRFLRKIGE